MGRRSGGWMMWPKASATDDRFELSTIDIYSHRSRLPLRAAAPAARHGRPAPRHRSNLGTSHPPLRQTSPKMRHGPAALDHLLDITRAYRRHEDCCGLGCACCNLIRLRQASSREDSPL